MTKEERIARIKLQKEEYNRAYKNLKDEKEYHEWLEDQLISTSNSLERRNSTTLQAKRMGATDEDIARVYALEDKNHHDAFYLMMEAIAMKAPFSEEFILSLHKQMLKEINDWEAGFYRHDRVRLLNSTTVLPSAIKVPVLMSELVDEVNNSKEEVVLESFDMHRRFVSIHPFIDGNGRTGRLLMNYNLLRNEYFPIVIRPKKRGEYLDSWERLDQNQGKENYYSFMFDELESTFNACMEKMISLPQKSVTKSLAVVAKHNDSKNIDNPHIKN